MKIGGVPVRVGGFAKGSGMIHPNMATMLAIITTDASVDAGLWRTMLQHGTAKSFNQVSSHYTAAQAWQSAAESEALPGWSFDMVSPHCAAAMAMSCASMSRQRAAAWHGMAESNIQMRSHYLLEGRKLGCLLHVQGLGSALC